MALNDAKMFWSVTTGRFARALIELYESEELWNRLSENGSQENPRSLFDEYRA